MSLPETFSSPTVAKKPFFAAAALFLSVAAFIGAFAIAPLGIAELLGLLACVAAASGFVTAPFVFDFARRFEARPPATPTEPAFSKEELGQHIAEVLDSRLAAALPEFTAQLSVALAEREEQRRAEIQAALTTTPPRQIDADALPASPSGGKSRLGRGLLGLMHGATAITPAETGETEKLKSML